MINEAIFLCKIGFIYEKRACKLNSKEQNSCSCVKIGFKILTITFTNTANLKKYQDTKTYNA